MLFGADLDGSQLAVDVVKSDLAGHDFIGTDFKRMRNASQSQQTTWIASLYGRASGRPAARAFCSPASRKCSIGGRRRTRVKARRRFCHRWSLVCTWPAVEFNAYVINTWIRCASGNSHRGKRHSSGATATREGLRPDTPSLFVEVVLDEERLLTGVAAIHFFWSGLSAFSSGEPASSEVTSKAAHDGVHAN